MSRVVTGLAVIYIVWGSTFVGIRVVVELAPPLTAMGIRFVTAGVLLAGLFAIRHRGFGQLRLTRRQCAGTALLGALLPLLGNGMVSVAGSHGAPAGFTALLIAITPLVIVIFRVIERDVPRPLTLIGVSFGFVGLAILVLLGRGAGDVRLAPAATIMLAATCWAAGSYLQPRLWLPGNPLIVAVWEMIWGGAFLLIAGLGRGERFTFDYPPRVWFAMAYLIVFGAVLAFSAYVWLVANVSISLVATHAYVNPVIAVFLGWLILSEAVSWPVVIGGATVIGAVAMVITAEHSRPKNQPDKRTLNSSTSAQAMPPSRSI